MAVATAVVEGVAGAVPGWRQAPVRMTSCVSRSTSTGATPRSRSSFSAAVAEAAAILSSLADLPIRQYLAVTGSVNQLGEVQPIGGVNEKIEGFFESCSRRGLTGKQGVIIPARNTKHLALRRDVVEAVESGRFTIYAVNCMEEAIELLTGVAAGERRVDGEYAADSVYGRAARRLEEMAQMVAEWSEGEERPGGHIIAGP